MWKFRRRMGEYYSNNSAQIKRVGGYYSNIFENHDSKNYYGRIWKLEPANPDAGFLIVYKDGSNSRYVPRWADLEDALSLRGDEEDRFKKANVITSVFVVPEVVGQVESDFGFLYDEGDSHEVYLHPYKDWTITQEWIPKNEESAASKNQQEQYLRKLLDNYETSGRLDSQGRVFTDGKGGPSAWIWNPSSPRRWKNINISGDNWAIVVDQEGEERMLLNIEDNFHAAINRKAFH